MMARLFNQNFSLGQESPLGDSLIKLLAIRPCAQGVRHGCKRFTHHQHWQQAGAPDGQSGFNLNLVNKGDLR
jgi:hypothetical protein